MVWGEHLSRLPSLDRMSTDKCSRDAGFVLFSPCVVDSVLSLSRTSHLAFLFAVSVLFVELRCVNCCLFSRLRVPHVDKLGRTSQQSYFDADEDKLSFKHRVYTTDAQGCETAPRWGCFVRHCSRRHSGLCVRDFCLCCLRTAQLEIQRKFFLWEVRGRWWRSATILLISPGLMSNDPRRRLWILPMCCFYDCWCWKHAIWCHILYYHVFVEFVSTWRGGVGWSILSMYWSSEVFKKMACTTWSKSIPRSNTRRRSQARWSSSAKMEGDKWGKDYHSLWNRGFFFWRLILHSANLQPHSNLQPHWQWIRRFSTLQIMNVNFTRP